MKMKHLLQEQSSPHLSNNASSSAGSRHDQETGSTTMSKDGDVLTKNYAFRLFPPELELNPLRMILAEMIGTFILVFCVCGIIASTERTRGEVGLLEYASTAALTVIVVIFTIGPVSGAHVNPAITIAFATFGHFPWSKVPLYILAQIVGSILASYVGKSVYGIKPEVMTTRPAQGCISAFWVEFMGTFILLFLAASLKYQAPSVGHLSGFVIGLAIGLAVLITGPVSGGSLNPARSLGPAIVSWNFKDIWVYMTAPIIGAIAGALMFHIVRIQRRPCRSTSSPDGTLLVHSIDFIGS